MVRRSLNILVRRISGTVELAARVEQSTSATKLFKAVADQ
jgi:hypothetical protein